jgi:hypothetical protein
MSIDFLHEWNLFVFIVRAILVDAYAVDSNYNIFHPGTAILKHFEGIFGEVELTIVDSNCVGSVSTSPGVGYCLKL